MPLLTKVGHFVYNSAVQDQVVTGVGFKAQSLLLWSTGGTASGTFRPGGRLAIGAATSEPSGNLHSYGNGGFRLRAPGNASGGADTATNANIGNVAIALEGLTSGLYGQDRLTAKVDTFTSDGFTVRWQPENLLFGPKSTLPVIINYLAIGGSDIISEFVEWPLGPYFPTGTNFRVYNSFVNESGQLVKYRPDALIHLYQYTYSRASLDGTDYDQLAFLGLGVTDSLYNEWSVSLLPDRARDEVENVISRRLISDDAAIMGIGASGESLLKVKITEFGPSRFTAHFVQGPPATPVPASNSFSGGSVITLAIQGVIARAGIVSKPTGAAPQSQIFSVGFRPKAYLLASSNQTIIDTQEVSGRISIGASDGVNARASAITIANGVATPNADSVDATDRVFMKVNNDTPAQDARANPGTIDYQGFTLDWTVNDSIETKIGYIALGDPGTSFSGKTSGKSRASLIVLFGGLHRGKATGYARTRAFIGPVALLRANLTGTSIITARVSALAKLSAESTGISQAAAELDTDLELVPVRVIGIGQANLDTLRRNVFFEGLRATAISFSEAQLRTDIIFLPPQLIGYSDSDAYLVLQLPKVAPSPAHHAPGTINLHRNPSVEKDLLDWFPVGEAAIERTATEQWHGNASVKVTIPDSIGAGFYAAGIKGLGLAAREWSVYGQVQLKGSGVTGIRAFMRGYYSDGTMEDGESINLGLGTGWLPYPVPAFLTDPDKIFIGADLVVERYATGPELILYADAVQIEEGQLSAFAYGGFGPPYYSWGGPSDASVSVRQPQPYIIGGIGDGGGVIEIEGHIFRSNYQNDYLEDLTDELIDARVTMDSERDYTWTLDATLTRRGWNKLRPERDWLSPRLTVRYPSGLVRTGQLGHFMVMDSPSDHTEWTETIDVQAFDALWLLDRQAFIQYVVAPINFNKMRFARLILDGAVLTGDMGEKQPLKRFSLPVHPEAFKGNREWDRETTRLDLVNEVVRSAGMHSVWTTRRGVITTHRRGVVRLLNQNPVRMWHANVPEGMDLADDVRFNPKIAPEIIGKVSKTPKSLDMVNEVLILGYVPEGLRAMAKKRIANIRNKRNRSNAEDDTNPSLTPAQREARRRRKARELRLPLLDDDATAAQVARALLDKWSTKDEVVDFAAVPDPAVEFTNECIYLGIWDGYGQEVAVGKYLVHKVSYGFTPRDGEMKITAGRVQHSEDIYE